MGVEQVSCLVFCGNGGDWLINGTVSRLSDSTTGTTAGRSVSLLMITVRGRILGQVWYYPVRRHHPHLSVLLQDGTLSRGGIDGTGSTSEVCCLITIFIGWGVTWDIEFFLAALCREGILLLGGAWSYWNLFQGLQAISLCLDGE